VYRRWLESKSRRPGDAFADTGLASAADVRALRWRPARQPREQFTRLLAEAAEHDRSLTAAGLEAEHERIVQLMPEVAHTLRRAGLDPGRFGVSPSG
jgi:hypothetical protein